MHRTGSHPDRREPYDLLQSWQDLAQAVVAYIAATSATQAIDTTNIAATRYCNCWTRVMTASLYMLDWFRHRAVAPRQTARRAPHETRYSGSNPGKNPMQTMIMISVKMCLGLTTARQKTITL